MFERLLGYMFWSGFGLLIGGFISEMVGVFGLNLQGGSLLFASIMMLSGIVILIVTVLLMGVSSQMREPPPQWPPPPFSYKNE